MRTSIKFKLAGTYAVIILCTLLFFSWLVFNALENYYLEAREKSFLTHANIIAGSGRDLLLSGDRNSVYWAGNYGENIGARVLMLNSAGKVIMDSFGESWLEGTVLGYDEVLSALKGNSGTGVHLLENGKRVLYVAVPVLENKEVRGVVMLVTGIDDIYDTLSRVRGQVVVLSLVSGLLAILLTLVVAGLLTNPIKELIAGVEKMTRGDFGVRVPVHSNDEMGQLAAAFNSMSNKLERVEQTRREFIANVSHEFQSPLGSIKILAQSLLESNEKDPGVYREFLADIDKEIDRLSRLAEELLYLVRLEEEGIEVVRKEQLIDSLVGRVFNLLYRQAGAKNIRLKKKVPEDLYWPVDEGLMVRILFNLVDNAIKYSPPEGGEVEVEALTGGDKLILRVRDNGDGIPEEDIPYLFNRFYRVDKARSRETGGSGLGLAIVKQGVQLHGGSIDVESGLQGTLFEIQIP